MQTIDGRDAPLVTVLRMLHLQKSAKLVLLYSVATQADHRRCQPDGAGSGQRSASSVVAGQERKQINCYHPAPLSSIATY